LPERLSDLVRSRLHRLGVASRWIEPEVAAMAPVRVKTVDRSVLGIMVDFAKAIPNVAGIVRPDAGLDLQEGHVLEERSVCGADPRRGSSGPEDPRSEGDMNDPRIRQVLGVMLLVGGVMLLFFGWQATGGMVEQMHDTLMGRYTDQTMWYLIGGAASAVGGAFLLMTAR
jgi:hypothetical protein